MSLALTLEKIRSGHVLERYELNGDKRTIYKMGRLPSADICIEDPLASRLHAIIDLSNKKAVLRDMGTPMGTTVNGHKVTRAALKTDDRITIGETTFHVVLKRSGLDKPPPLPSPEERKREHLIDAVATMTPHSAEQLQMFANFLKARRQNKIVVRSRDASTSGSRAKAAVDDSTVHEVGASQIMSIEPPADLRPRTDSERRAAPRIKERSKRSRTFDTGLVLRKIRVQRHRTRSAFIGAGAIVIVLAVVPFWVPDTDWLTEKVQAAKAADTAAEAPATTEQRPTTRSYTVKPGDSLGLIAKRELGDVQQWSAIFEANRGVLSDPSEIEVGMVLQLPVSRPSSR